MKKFLILIVFIFSSLLLFSQNDFTDIIYPLDGRGPIKNCNIVEIKNNNTILYILKDKTKEIEAISIKKDGAYIDLSEFLEESSFNGFPEEAQERKVKQEGQDSFLYRGHDYDYYLNKSIKATKQRNSGIALTVMGLIACGISYNSDGMTRKDAVIFLLGSVVADGGIALWISGGIVNQNNKKAMSQFNQDKLSLNVGATQNGMGLILKF